MMLPDDYFNLKQKNFPKGETIKNAYRRHVDVRLWEIDSKTNKKNSKKSL